MQPSSAISPAALADDLHALAAFLMRTANADVLRRMAELELSVSQIKALHVLDRAPPLALKDLAAQLALSVPAASRAVDGLVRAGLAAREEDAADRRVRRVCLTPAGRRIVADLGERRRAALQAFAETLSADERTAVAEALVPLLSLPQVAACRPKESA